MRQFTLRKRKVSRHDLSHRKTLGATNIVIPPSGTIKSFATEILNQGDKPSCTAYTACEIRKVKTGKTYDPEQQWQAELKIWGDTNAQGIDLQTQGATGVKIGFYPVGSDTPTDQASAYIFVTKNPFSKIDLFDLLRATMMQVGPLSGGMDWYNDWTNAPNGIMPHSFTSLDGGHDIELCGLNFINGVDYIDLQQTWGEGAGDKGIYHADRFMINKILAEWGALYWSDDPREKFKKTGLLEALMVNLVNLLTRLYSKVVSTFIKK